MTERRISIRICICSDTHGDACSLRELFAREQPEALLFLGDGAREFLSLELPPALLAAGVRGNCDFVPLLPTERLLTLDGTVFYLTHGHLQGVKQGLYGLRTAAPAEAQVVCYGHTHVADIRAEDGRIYLCPGSLRNGGSYAVYETGTPSRYGIRILK